METHTVIKKSSHLRKGKQGQINIVANAGDPAFLGPHTPWITSGGQAAYQVAGPRANERRCHKRQRLIELQHNPVLCWNWQARKPVLYPV